MSVICNYVRARPDLMDDLCADPDNIFDRCLDSKEIMMIDIDKATDGLAWLVSPHKRAEAAYHSRLVTDRDWPDEDARAAHAAIDDIPIDHALCAIEGSKIHSIVFPNIGLGAVLHPVARVPILSAALDQMSEDSLRPQLDFALMDRDDVLPGYWTEDGEDNFLFYLLPHLSRLQRFYRAATDAREAVLLIWT